MHDDVVKTLIDARHAPKLKKIFISLGTLDSNGCTYKAKSEIMRISKGPLIVMKGQKNKWLFTQYEVAWL